MRNNWTKSEYSRDFVPSLDRLSIVALGKVTWKTEASTRLSGWVGFEVKGGDEGSPQAK